MLRIKRFLTDYQISVAQNNLPLFKILQPTQTKNNTFKTDEAPWCFKCLDGIGLGEAQNTLYCKYYKSNENSVTSNITTNEPSETPRVPLIKIQGKGEKTRTFIDVGDEIRGKDK